MTDDSPVSAPVSWARNGEDVVLLRALRHVGQGRFLEVRATGVDGPPALQALLDQGWVGTVTDLDGSAARAADPVPRGDGPLHAVLVATDVTADDREAVVALAHRGPWVLVVGVHPDLDRGPLIDALAAAGYRCRLYDGVSAYFVQADRDAELGGPLSYPACARDGYVTGAAAELLRTARLREEAALESALRWREKAVQSWADRSTGPVGGQGELQALRDYADDLAKQLVLQQQTVSWRVTAPLRMIRRLGSADPA